MARWTALLLTDIVESTALASRLGDAEMSDVWAAHDRIAHDLLHAWRGRVLDRSDGVLVAFDAAADAARYAIEYQRALRAMPVPLQARAGVHVGELIERRNDATDFAVGAKPIELDGLARHITSRVMSVAGAGQVLLTADACNALGAAGLHTECHGHWRFKGIDEPMELFEVGTDSSAFVPPSDAQKAYRVVRNGDFWVPRRELRHSLPAERDFFVGRGDMLHRLALGYRAGARLISLTGTGGAGKTRLSQRFGWHWLGDFDGGVWFCDLSQARTLDGVLHATGQGLDIPLAGGDAAAQIGNAIAGRGNCLVILDNFEQVVVHAEATVSRWLDRAPDARFLVTTRERLQLPGEQAIELPPLPPEDAVVLFTRRAEAVGLGYAPHGEDHAAIFPLVKLLDGLPLAIELAAARVRVMSPRLLLSRMAERFTLLALPRRAGRQATLRATLDWSWDLLSDAERSALAQLSVFEGGFTYAAAAAVLELSAQPDAPDVLDLLQSLVDKSLVRTPVGDRFRMLSSIQEYAAQALRTAGNGPHEGEAAWRATCDRHLRHFATADGIEAGAELDNLVAACRHAAAHAQPGLAAKALVRAWSVLKLRGPFTAGRALADLCLAQPDVAPADELALRLVAGAAEQLSGQVARAVAHFDAGLAQAVRVGERRSQGHFLESLAQLDSYAGRPESSAERHDAALAIARAIGDAPLECAALNGRGSQREYAGRFAEARADYQVALRVAQQSGSRRDEGSSLGNLGQFLANQGLGDEARQHYLRALAIARELGDRQREGNTLCNLGLLDHTDGRHDAALEHLRAALALATELGHVRLEAVVRCNLGLASDAIGRRREAIDHHEAALAVARRLGDRRSEGQFLGYLGVCLGREGERARALECLRQAEALSRTVGDALNIGLLFCHEAETEWHAGHATEAARLLDRARSTAAALGASPRSELGQAIEALALRINAAG